MKKGARAFKHHFLCLPKTTLLKKFSLKISKNVVCVTMHAEYKNLTNLNFLAVGSNCGKIFYSAYVSPLPLLNFNLWEANCE